MTTRDGWDIGRIDGWTSNKEVFLLFGWTKEQWAVVMTIMRAEAITIGEAAKVQAQWHTRYTDEDPPEGFGWLRGNTTAAESLFRNANRETRL